MAENDAQTQEQKPSDKELNFRMLEAKYEKQLAQERAARLEAEKAAQEALHRIQASAQEDDEDDDSEPYVDHKRLNKTLSSFERKLEEKIEKKSEEKARALLFESKKDQWIRSNPDFVEVLQHADKLYQEDPELAETILEMPEGFERQKLVYKSIKNMGLHKEKPKAPTIQEKIDSNRRSPYYQPSSVPSAPYSNGGDFSEAGQENAYKKMQELKKTLRI